MADSTKSLSLQEIKILGLLAQGLGYIEIANTLGITRLAISGSLRNISKKTGIYSRVLLAFYAYSKGYVTNAEIKEAIQKERQKRL